MALLRMQSYAIVNFSLHVSPSVIIFYRKEYRVVLGLAVIQSVSTRVV